MCEYLIGQFHLADYAGPFFYDVAKAFCGALFALLIARPIRAKREQWLYGGWAVVLKRDETIIHTINVTTERGKSVRNDEHELRVYLKGIVSVYERLNTDIIINGEKLGLLQIDDVNRRYTIDLARNPKLESRENLVAESKKPDGPDVR